MTTAAITSKNQITLPKIVREGLGVRDGDKVQFERLPDGRFAVGPKKAGDWRALIDVLAPHLEKPVPRTSVEDMHRAIAEFVARDHERILGKRRPRKPA